jgi:hypothetical protein
VKATLFLSVAAGILLALPASQVAWGKAHVPLDRAQICVPLKGDDGGAGQPGKVKTIKLGKLGKELAKGDGRCRLPTCVFPGGDGRQVVFHSGDSCTLGATAGFCITPGSPADLEEADFRSAVGERAACTNPF